MRNPIVVLKFGSSVLRSEADLALAVHEIYRWMRTGNRVIAVVSAIGDTTDSLLSCAKAYGSTPVERGLAALLGTGETKSAALLNLALDRAGIPAAMLDEVQLGLITTGPVLDGELCGLNLKQLTSTLQRFPVVVVPGFVGRQRDGGISLLGRGGTDLTAIFVAQRINAQRCRLIKNVDGVFEQDPAASTGRVRRYRTLCWTDARQLPIDAAIVQQKAIGFAEQAGFCFEVACLNSDSPTTIGPEPTTFYSDPSSPLRPIRVGLLGAGTVGLGVYRRLASHPESFEITGIAVRRIHRHDGTPSELLTGDPWSVVESDCDVVIELIGGASPATDLITAALKDGKHVITANKLVISREGRLLHRLATQTGAHLCYSAAVGGAVPMLEQVKQVARNSRIMSISGVVNGTTNFVLDRMGEGISQEDAVREAQQLGFAEQDPTSDLDGSDAAHKLSLLAECAFGTWLDSASISRAGIDQLDAKTVRQAAESGRSYRLVASLKRTPNGVQGTVAPAVVASPHAFAKVRNEENCLEIFSERGEILRLHGKGAGRWPTTESVIADAFDVARSAQEKSAAYAQGRFA